MTEELHILLERVKGLLRARATIGPTTWLDDLVDEVAETKSLDRRKVVWAEIVRRFIHDVDRTCRIAGATDARATADMILDEALRGIASEAAKFFTSELVRIMKKHLGEQSVRSVQRSLYLRQFLTELPPRLVPYAEGFLNQEGHAEWLAEHRSESVEEVRKRCAEAWKRLPPAVESEYADEEIAERTEGVWTIRQLKEIDVP